jgi:hypothetical protein
MKLKITFILFFIACFYAKAQKSIPGYLGSRNLLSVKYMPDLYIGNDGPATILRIFNPTIGVTYERAMSRKTSLSFSAGRMNSMVYAGEYDNFRESRRNDLFVTIDKQPVKVDKLKGFVRYRNNYFSVSKSYYRLRSGSIAPQGKFLKIGFTLNNSKIRTDSLTYTLSNKNTINNNGKSYQGLTLTSFHIEFGAKRFIGKHLFIQKSVAFNIPFNFWDTTRSKYYYNIEDYNETHLAYYLSRKQTLNFSLAIGAAF